MNSFVIFRCNDIEFVRACVLCANVCTNFPLVDFFFAGKIFIRMQNTHEIIIITAAAIILKARYRFFLLLLLFVSSCEALSFAVGLSCGVAQPIRTLSNDPAYIWYSIILRATKAHINGRCCRRTNWWLLNEAHAYCISDLVLVLFFLYSVARTSLALAKWHTNKNRYAIGR